MQERTDLNDAAQTITTLFNIGVRLREDVKNWSHWKNNEDYRHIYSLPHEQKYPMECIYSYGRGFCGDLASETNHYLYDHAEFPTVSEIVKSLDKFITKLDFEKIYADAMEQKKIAQFDNNFAFEAMCYQFKQQMKLVDNLKLILNTLRSTDQFKSENDMPKSNNNSSVTFNNSSNINYNSGSTNTQQTITVNDGLGDLIGQMITAVKDSSIADKAEIIAAIEELQDTKAPPESRYGTFITKTKDHIAIIAPFIAPLAKILMGA